MSDEWTRQYENKMKWLRLAARLEGAIEAHKILKAGNGDAYDKVLWDISGQALREAEDA